VDLVGSYRGIDIGAAKLTINVAGNYLIANDLIGSLATPDNIASKGGSIFTPTEQALMLTSRPKYKYVFGGDLNYRKWNFYLNFTTIGPVYFSQLDLADLDGTAVGGGSETLQGNRDLQVAFMTKTLTDLSVSYSFNQKSSISITASNIFNVYPEWQLKALTQNGQDFLNGQSSLNLYGVTTTGQQNVRLLKDGLTFNNRYQYVTSDGSHFSQIGTTFMMQLVHKF
jgi:iron complex outermembrane receptor protein